MEKLLTKSEINKKFDVFESELQELLQKHNMEFELYGGFAGSELDPYCESESELRIVYNDNRRFDRKHYI